MKIPTIEEVILLFESEENNNKNIFGLGYAHIAKKLKADPLKTLNVMLEMEELSILERLSGAEFILNPKDMWKI